MLADELQITSYELRAMNYELRRDGLHIFGLTDYRLLGLSAFRIQILIIMPETKPNYFDINKITSIVFDVNIFAKMIIKSI